MLPAADCPVPLESRRVVSLPGLGCLAENTGKDCGSMLKPYLEAGKITGTQGLRGEIRVDPWCDSAEALCRLKRLYFEEGKQELKVVSARTQKRMAILKLEGVDSIEQADLLRNRVLYASRQDFKLEPGGYFIQDLHQSGGCRQRQRLWCRHRRVENWSQRCLRDHRRRWKGVSAACHPYDRH